MSDHCTVVIGAAEWLDSLRRGAGEGEVLSFHDTDALAALDAITKRRPRVVALERLFAATSRGAALINRIKADPDLAGAEIRIVSHDGTYSRVSARRGAPAPAAQAPDEAAAGVAAEAGGAPAAVAPAAPTLDYRGTRRAPRVRMADGTEVQVDGALAKVVDLSAIGAQILSPVPLKPQQKLRVMLADDLGMVRCSAVVAWASFEILKVGSQYRAGIEFKDADPKAVAAFSKRHAARR